ncbi:hypothetical protein BDR26DRAFT_858719 [Obelidium mucronatum]|nr:hypothetical protein BDR26DRAFT_858719 [Obelidium mucronatum]
MKDQQVIPITPAALFAKSRILGRQLKSKVLNRLKVHLLEARQGGAGGTTGGSADTRDLERKLEAAQRNLAVQQERLRTLKKDYDSVIATVKAKELLLMFGGSEESENLNHDSGESTTTRIRRQPMIKRPCITKQEALVAAWILFLFCFILAFICKPNHAWVLWEVRMSSHRVVAQAVSGVF